MELRPNQFEPVQKGIEYFSLKKAEPSIIVAPTAFGKSIVIAHIAKGIEEKVLVLQPSKELLEQNYNKFVYFGGTASTKGLSSGTGILSSQVGKTTVISCEKND